MVKDEHNIISYHGYDAQPSIWKAHKAQVG